MKHTPPLACMELMWGSVAGEKFEPWLREIAAIGFDGIGIREATVQPFYADPKSFTALLGRHGLALGAVYAEVHVDFPRYEALCRFMQAVNCENLVLYGGRGPAKKDREIMAQLMNHIASIAAPFDVVTMHHHHTSTFSETMEQTEHVLSLTNPETFGVFCDVGHATKDFAGHPEGKRAQIFMERNWPRVQMIEFKDWNPQGELSIELGQGRADYPSLFRFLDEKKYGGWIVFEQNSPCGNKTPAQCAKNSFEFVVAQAVNLRKEFATAKSTS